jgi:hypothetical protein
MVGVDGRCGGQGVAYAHGGQAGLGGAEWRFREQLASCGASKLAAQ